MKTLSKKKILFVVLVSTLSYSALGASSEACVGFYDKIYVARLESARLVETSPLSQASAQITLAPQRVRKDDWSLPRFFKEKKEVVVSARWKKMIEHNDTVAYKYEEKTFKRKTITGTKYIVSYHV